MLSFGPAIPSAQLKEMLTAWIVAKFPAAANQAKLHLFQNNVTPSQASVLADFTEADFDGYVSQNMQVGTGWTAAAMDGDGNVRQIDDTLYTFVGDDPQGTPNTIYGFYITDQGGTTFIAAARFATPMDFTVASATVTIEIGMRLIEGAAEPGFDAEYAVNL